MRTLEEIKQEKVQIFFALLTHVHNCTGTYDTNLAFLTISDENERAKLEDLSRRHMYLERLQADRDIRRKYSGANPNLRRPAPGVYYYQVTKQDKNGRHGVDPRY